MTAPMCPTCGGWGYVSDCDDRGEDPRVVPCWRGCPEPELPSLEALEAIRLADRRSVEDYVTRHMEAETCP